MEDKIILTLSKVDNNKKISISISDIDVISTDSGTGTTIYLINSTNPIYVKETFNEIHAISHQIKLKNRKFIPYRNRDIFEVLECTPENKSKIFELIGGGYEVHVDGYDFSIKNEKISCCLNYGNYIIKCPNGKFIITTEESLNKEFEEIQ